MRCSGCWVLIFDISLILAKASTRIWSAISNLRILVTAVCFLTAACRQCAGSRSTRRRQRYISETGSPALIEYWITKCLTKRGRDVRFRRGSWVWDYLGETLPKPLIKVVARLLRVRTVETQVLALGIQRMNALPRSEMQMLDARYKIAIPITKHWGELRG